MTTRKEYMAAACEYPEDFDSYRNRGKYPWNPGNSDGDCFRAIADAGLWETPDGWRMFKKKLRAAAIKDGDKASILRTAACDCLEAIGKAKLESTNDR